MSRLTCISILEPGSFATDSGTVTVPTGEHPFPIVISGAGVTYTYTYGYAVMPDDDENFLLLF